MSSESIPAVRREVRDLRDGETRDSAALHARLLRKGFFARLGIQYLRCYHRTYVASPHAVALAATADDQLEGFLLAVLRPGPHGAYVLRRWGPELAARGAVALLARPAVLLLFVRTRALRYARGLWRRSRAAAAPPSQADGLWAVLSHVAVDDARQGAGVGAALVDALHDRVRADGGTGVVLLTDPYGPAPGFYRRLGYDEEGPVAGADRQQWLRFRRRLR